MIARVIVAPAGTTTYTSPPGPELAGVVEGSVVELHLDVAHDEYYRAEVLCHPEYYSQTTMEEIGWIAKNRLELANPLLAEYDYDANGDDELGFKQGETVFGFVEVDGWWEGYNPSNGQAGMFPGNYIKVLPKGAVAATVPRPAPAPAAVAAAAAPPEPFVPQALPMRMPQPSKFEETKTGPQTVGGAMVQNPMAGKAVQPAAKATAKGSDGKFDGVNEQQFAIWAHYQAYMCAFTAFFCGIYTVTWANGDGWKCEIEGKTISDIYILNKTACGGGNSTGRRLLDHHTCCTAGHCCDPTEFNDVDLWGSLEIGALSILMAFLIPIFENEDFGFGLWMPTTWWWYERRVSPHALVYFICAVINLGAFPSAFTAICLLICAYTYQYAFWRQEAGDGGRERRQVAKQRAAERKAKADKQEDGWPLDWYRTTPVYEAIFRPVSFYRKLVREDKLSIYAWTSFFVFLNLFQFFFALGVWVDLVNTVQEDMIDGKLKVGCSSEECKTNRGRIEYGFVSDVGPLAKACGACLNLNCALIVMPVTKLLLARLNNLGNSYNSQNASANIFSQWFARCCAGPFTRYVPLSKNIEFHKLIAYFIFVFAWGHTIFHFANYELASVGTLHTFEKFGWGGTTFLTGFFILLSMFFIYTAALNRVKRAMYEVFFYNHHWFIVFFFMLLLHGPVFWAWSLIPLLLYITERVLQQLRGQRAFLVTRVEWVKPVLAVKICPLDRSSFIFREGQYLYLNCPYINKNEWHPFTISSARGDLSIPGGPSNPLRVAIDTGEEVMEVPRPAGLDKKYRWAKYCPVSADYNKMNDWEFLDKHETCYHDYVSVHIKVHGLNDPVARSWTRKLKEYIELMSPGQSFPYHFSSRDSRGDLMLGRRFGVDNQPILRVDGPHSAPAEHYLNYKTVMVIGAGIGMTPCASVLSAMLKYRWRFGQPPEKLHFYWIVQHGEVDAFQWFLHLITELEHIHFKQRSGATTDEARADWRRYYCEINMYVTRAPKEKKAVPPMVSAPKFIPPSETLPPRFTVDQLYAEMYNPSVSSRKQVETMSTAKDASNRLQDVWVWNGRPDWDQVFANMARGAVDPDIGVFFCGAAVIGADLQTMCQKHSINGGVAFSLHKENF